MNYEARRQQVLEKMEKGSVLVLFSGIETHVSNDEYAPFEANRNFFYLTGLRRDRMILVMDKAAKEPKTTLYIEEADPTVVRWTGKKVSMDEAKEITGIETVRYIDGFEADMNRIMRRGDVETLYFDCFRYQMEDMPDYNVIKADEYAKKYLGVTIKNLHPIVAEMRMQKDAEEVALIKEAVRVTDEGLKNVLKNLKPEQKEYQAQADFEYIVHYLGGERPSFATIAGSGINGTMLHYETNRDTCKDGDLILLDLGTKWEGYCSDITRTYPINGKYSERQRQVYDIVLKANRAVVDAAKPGVTLIELNNICKRVLAEGCIELGLIKEESEIGKYYMHGVA
ncbi:MAG: aminopeptidase P N-terminal domain-containing protein, partial [Roseburia sp.]|nr:aminopeptidase P N-terminal domain-containing protein [Roseburia sp.]